MTLEEKLKQAKENEAKAWKALLDENTKPNLEAYKTASELILSLEEEIVKTSQREDNAGLVKNEDEQKSEKDLRTLTEKRDVEKFLKEFSGAVTEGRAYSGLIPTSIAKKIDAARDKVAKLRNYCTVHPTKGYQTIPIDDDDVSVYYVGQDESNNDTQTLRLTDKTLGSYDLNAIVKIHENDLADVTTDLEAWIVSKFSKAYAKMEDREILFGAGSLSDNITGIVTELKGTPNVKEVEQSNFNWTAVSDFIDSLGDYSETSVLVMKHETVAKIKKFQTSVGNYLFPQNEKLKTINDIPIVECKELDSVSNLGHVIVAGDFSYYHIADRQSMDIKVLRERYADANQVGIRATRRIDGNLSIKEAFKVLKVVADAVTP